MLTGIPVGTKMKIYGRQFTVIIFGIFFSFQADYNWVKQRVYTENFCGGPLTTSCERGKEAMAVFKT